MTSSIMSLLLAGSLISAGSCAILAIRRMQAQTDASSATSVTHLARHDVVQYIAQVALLIGALMMGTAIGRYFLH